MKKTDLVRQVSRQSELTLEQSRQLLDCVFGSIKRALLNGDSAVLPGLGKLSLARTEARVGRNPRTGQNVDIPAGKRALFRTSPSFRAELREF
ncbi:HU family DNA-binding protein [Desulfovibrio sp. OttesenSCG-928-C14]|nr:HU family DNA-binding protein [Desulfovibrio sp. OttesenSCG-928-C14]